MAEDVKPGVSASGGEGRFRAQQDSGETLKALRSIPRRGLPALGKTPLRDAMGWRARAHGTGQLPVWGTRDDGREEKLLTLTKNFPLRYHLRSPSPS